MPTSRESLITVLYGSTATGAPADLYDGEFAFANASGTGKKLFIGSGGNNTSNWVGAVIEDQATINWSSVTSENNKLPTQWAVKSLANGYLPLAGGSMTGDITLGTAAELNFTATGGGGGTIKIQAPAATTSNAAYTFTLPANDGSAAEVLTTDGNGVLTWSSAGTATNVSVTEDDSSTTTYIAFTTATSGATALRVDSDGITYNASTDTLTLAGDISVNGGDVITTSASASVFPNTATSVTIGGAATTLGLGATSGSGTTTVNNQLRVGLSQGTIITPAGSATNHLNFNPSGNFRVIPTSNVVGGGSRPNLIVENSDGAAGVVEISGGNLYLGRKTSDDSTYTAVGIIFEGSTNDGNETLLTVANPTAARTITLPDASGTVAIVAGSDTQVMFNDGGSSLGGDSGLTYNKTTDSLTIAGDIAVNGASITSTSTGTAAIFDNNVTAINLGRACTSITIGASSGTTTTVRGGTLVGNTTTQNLFNTAATTVNFAGAATSLSIGAATGTTTINNANTVVTGDLSVDGGDITTSAGTATIFNSTATTITMGGAATNFTAAGAAGAQTVTIGGSSTAASTYNFGTGTTASSTTKTVNLGTGGGASSTTNVNIGSSNGGTVAIGYNATIGNDLTVTGNLTVSGDTITQNVSTLTVEDPLIKLASGNTGSDLLDIGFYGTYDTSGTQDLFCGLFRDQTDGKFRLFVDSQTEPTTTVNTGATGYTVATLVANIRGGTFS